MSCQTCGCNTCQCDETSPASTVSSTRMGGTNICRYRKDGDLQHGDLIAVCVNDRPRLRTINLQALQGPPGDSVTGPRGLRGLSAYEIWQNLGNTGTQQQFIDSLKGEDGDDSTGTGSQGDPGDSAYDIWIALGNTGTQQDFIDSLQGEDGTGSTFDPNDICNVTDAGDLTVGTDVIACGPAGLVKYTFTGALAGAPGDSAYDIWIALGNTGTQQDFIDSLNGEDGTDGVGTPGASAYDIWLSNGGVGTVQDFLDSLQGEDGDDGNNTITTAQVCAAWPTNVIPLTPTDDLNEWDMMIRNNVTGQCGVISLEGFKQCIENRAGGGNTGTVTVVTEDQVNTDADSGTYTPNYTNTTGDPASFAATGLPPGATIDPATGDINYSTMTPGTYGTVCVTINT